MRGFAALVMAVLGVAECDRAPAEETVRRAAVVLPPGSTQAVASAAPPARPDPPLSFDAVGTPGRCVQPSPSRAPISVPHGPAPGCPQDPEPGLAALPMVHVTFADVGGVAVDAELARSEHDTMRGLMYRTHMPEEQGMLFDLRIRDDHKFWMHNTCIPLDLLYVDEDGLIVGIVESAPTLDDQSRGVGCPSRFVLEVNAGWSRRHGVRAGQRIKMAP